MDNPNNEYKSDSTKVRLAKKIPFSTCQDYVVSITWRKSGSIKKTMPASTIRRSVAVLMTK